MRLSGLAVAAILLFSSVVVAQHSSGGGGSSGGSSGSGGSHSNYSGGGSSSGGSATHSASPGSRAYRSSHQTSGSNAAPAIRERGIARVPSQPEKRTFFSFLRHPFSKPQPKSEANLRRRICAKGPCPVCPAGQAYGKNGACVASPQGNLCRTGEYWSGGGCVLFANFLANCSIDPDGELMAARRNMEATKRAWKQRARRIPLVMNAQRRTSSTSVSWTCTDSGWNLTFAPTKKCQRRPSFVSPLGLYSDPLLP